ncbi:hypothetical protein BJ912DRAFT_1081678 [Pholiota molesta]|nr:hypothetical protein BJ912DRAFT_1081678 [Pholiota molesta]
MHELPRPTEQKSAPCAPRTTYARNLHFYLQKNQMEAASRSPGSSSCEGLQKQTPIVPPQGGMKIIHKDPRAPPGLATHQPRRRKHRGAKGLDTLSDSTGGAASNFRAQWPRFPNTHGEPLLDVKFCGTKKDEAGDNSHWDLHYAPYLVLICPRPTNDSKRGAAKPSHRDCTERTHKTGYQQWQPAQEAKFGQYKGARDWTHSSTSQAEPRGVKPTRKHDGTSRSSGPTWNQRQRRGPTRKQGTYVVAQMRQRRGGRACCMKRLHTQGRKERVVQRWSWQWQLYVKNLRTSSAIPDVKLGRRAGAAHRLRPQQGPSSAVVELEGGGPVSRG